MPDAVPGDYVDLPNAGQAAGTEIIPPNVDPGMRVFNDDRDRLRIAEMLRGDADGRAAAVAPQTPGFFERMFAPYVEFGRGVYAGNGRQAQRMIHGAADAVKAARDLAEGFGGSDLPGLASAGSVEEWLRGQAGETITPPDGWLGKMGYGVGHAPSALASAVALGALGKKLPSVGPVTFPMLLRSARD